MKVEDVLDIINANHSNPHSVLGQHLVSSINGKQECITITVFLPNAMEVKVIDKKTKKSYVMNKVHDDGIFYIKTTKKSFFKYLLEITYNSGDIFTTEDPYSFLPTFGDLDIHLFNQGCHYEIYEHMGAKFKEVDGVNGVSFVLWAPNAKRVSVIGSFNSWDGRVHPMRTLGSSGIWEIFIPNLKNFDKYKFELKYKDGTLCEKSDPYGNFQELRPSESNLLFNINNYEWKDSTYISNRREGSTLNKPISIYEMHLGSWKRIIEENQRFISYIEACKMVVSYVKEMGYTHIELLGIIEHPLDASWGYQVTGYYSATSRFGTPTELMAFVDECHKNNIGVILDWVPAHFVKDKHGLAKFDGTALYEHADPRKGEHPEWGTHIYNYGRNEVKNFLIGSALFWLEKYHFDGIRVDAVASMLYLDYGKKEGGWIPNQYGGRENLEAVEFLKHLNSIVLGRDESILMIAEESTSWPKISAPTSEGGLGFNLKWNMGWMNDTNRYIKLDPIYRQYHHNDLTFSMVYAYTENFVLVLSHDEVVHGKGSLINKMPGDLWQKFANLRNYYSYMYGHPGKKLLFMGQEFGQFSEWSEARSLDWHLLEFDHHKGLQNFVKDLNKLYKKEDAFWKYDFDSKGFSWLDVNNNLESILAFLRKGDKEEDYIFVINNFTPTVRYGYKLKVPFPCELVEVLNSDSKKYGGSGIKNTQKIRSYTEDGENYVDITVPPLGSLFLKTKNKFKKN
ncbi:MAG: 1,4-alpha-glucan branching protein GlgB [Lachnospirales bacterium]